MTAIPFRLSPAMLPEHALPPVAGMTVGVNLRALRSSGAMQTAFEKMGSFAPPEFLAQFNQSMAALNDIDSIVCAVTGPQAAPQPLILLTGRFQNAAWAQQMKLSPQQLAHANAILFGPQLAVSASMSHFRAAPVPPTALAVRAVAFAASYDVWVLIDQPDMVKQIRSRLPAQLKVGDPDIRGLEMGLALRDKPHTLITLITGTKAGADALESALRTEAAAPDQKQKFEIQRFDNAVRISIEGSKDMLQALTPAEKPSEHPGKVVIYGLEEKPKTVPIR